jgi:uncharacterized integral membrane protein
VNVLRLVVVFVIALIIVAVVVANREPASLDLVAAKIAVPMYAVVLLAWAFGLVSYAIFALIGEIRLRTRLARLQRKNEDLQEELTDLRNLPLAGDETKAPGEEPPARAQPEPRPQRGSSPKEQS